MGYHHTQNVRNLLVYGHYSLYPASDVKRPGDFWSYLKNGMLNDLFPANSGSVTADQVNYRVGAVRLRQIRVRNGERIVTFALESS